MMVDFIWFYMYRRCAIGYTHRKKISSFSTIISQILICWVYWLPIIEIIESPNIQLFCLIFVYFEFKSSHDLYRDKNHLQFKLGRMNLDKANMAEGIRIENNINFSQCRMLNRNKITAFHLWIKTVHAFYEMIWHFHHFVVANPCKMQSNLIHHFLFAKTLFMLDQYSHSDNNRPCWVSCVYVCCGLFIGKQNAIDKYLKK